MRGTLGCLLGFRPLGQNPAGAISTACFVDSLKFVCFYNKREKKQIKKPGHLGVGPGCLKQSSDKPVSNLNSDMKAKSKLILTLFVYNLMIRLSLIRL